MEKANGELKIETGIPIPSRHKNKGFTEVLRKLRKGESVLLPTRIQSVHSLFSQVGAKSGDFTCRSEGLETRVWRVTAQR